MNVLNFLFDEHINNIGDYSSSDSKMFSNCFGAINKYKTETDEKDDLITRQHPVFDSYDKVETLGYIPNEISTEHLKKPQHSNIHHRASVIRSPSDAFTLHKEFEQRNLLLYNAEMMKLQGTILQKKGKSYQICICLAKISNMQFCNGYIRAISWFNHKFCESFL